MGLNEMNKILAGACSRQLLFQYIVKQEFAVGEVLQQAKGRAT